MVVLVVGVVGIGFDVVVFVGGPRSGEQVSHLPASYINDEQRKPGSQNGKQFLICNERNHEINMNRITISDKYRLQFFKRETTSDKSNSYMNNEETKKQ